jgi:PKD repeat protein
VKFLLYNLTILAIAVFIVGTISCKKTENAAKTTVIYDFVYRGTPITGDTIFFLRTPASGGKFLWNFGDSTMSTESIPHHIYNTSGTRTITLVIDNDTSHIVSHAITIFNDPIYTHLMGGVRVWHHIYTSSRAYPPSSNTVIEPDISFELTYIDPITISNGNGTLLFSPSESTDSSIVFNSSSEDYNQKVRFIYTTGRISLDEETHISAGSSSSDFYYTP